VMDPFNAVTAPENSEEPGSARWFSTTHWSVVLAAGEGDSEEAQRALGNLCQTYWYPLYAYVRSRGFGPEDAEDLTQGFFAQLLERNSVGRADRQRGKFRYFLLGALKNYLCDANDKATALKRGGGRKPISFDAQTAEERFKLEPIDTLTPEKVYERRWGLILLDQALRRLRGEYAAAGKEELYEALEGFLTDTRDAPSYAELAARLGTTEGAIKSALHRLRQRHRELVRDEIAQTVSTPVEVEEEIRHLIGVISG
jgi:RNA polymerase sigma factor (sigma-70 family)